MNRNSPGPDIWRRTLLIGAAVATLSLARPLCDLSNHQTTPRGGHYTRLFPDHSEVELNTDTSMSFDFSARHRSVTLAHGEAFFRVADQSQPPVSVFAGSVSLRAADATFSVRRLEADTVSVYVSNGTVLMHQTLMQKAMSTGFEIDATLIAGHTARLHSGALSLGTFSTTDAICQWAWRRGKICFSGQTLSDAVAEVNRYREQQVIIGDPALSKLQIGGVFDVSELSGFTEALARTFQILVIPRHNSLVLVRGPFHVSAPAQFEVTQDELHRSRIPTYPEIARGNELVRTGFGAAGRFPGAPAQSILSLTRGVDGAMNSIKSWMRLSSYAQTSKRVWRALAGWGALSDARRQGRSRTLPGVADVGWIALPSGTEFSSPPTQVGPKNYATRKKETRSVGAFRACVSR